MSRGNEKDEFAKQNQLNHHNQLKICDQTFPHPLAKTSAKCMVFIGM